METPKSRLSVCMLGETATKGSLGIFNSETKQVCERFSKSYISDMRRLLENDSEALPHLREALSSCDAESVYVAEAGESLFKLLYRIAEDKDSGIEVSLPLVPVRQQTIELYEIIRDNPFLGDSEGVCVILTEDEAVLSEKLGAGLQVIGHLRDDRRKIVINGEETRFLTP